MKSSLRIKAKELNFDPIEAEKFYVHGETAETVLADFAEYQANAIKEGIEKDIKTRFGNTTPVDGNKKKTTPRADVEAEYKKAEENRDAPLMMVLKAKLEKMPVEELN